MSDWKVGDKAVCVDASPPRDLCGDGGIETQYARNLIKGRIYEVTTVVLCRCGKHVGIGDKPAKAGGSADRFRKLVSDEHKACEPEFVQLLKRSKSPAHAVKVLQLRGRVNG